MDTKKISVNPAFLKINGSKTLKKRERKERRIRDDLHKKQNNELKKGLLEKIKTHKKRKQEERKRLQQEMKQMGDVDANELDKSLDYLHQLSNKHKSKKQKKRELKLARKMERQSRIEQSISQTNQTPLISNPYTSTQPPAIKPSTTLQPPLININTIQTPSQPTVPQPSPTPTAYILPDNPPQLQPVSIQQQTISPTSIQQSIMQQKPDPPYGILKNGKKPLFSIYNKTLKKPTDSHVRTTIQSAPPIIMDDDIKINTDTFAERKEKLNQLKQQVAGDRIPNQGGFKPKRGKTLKKMKQISTTTKRFIHLGKKNGKVGVLIKNQKTRKKILKDSNTLKKRPLSKIKDYLRKHNLIKIGSTAPETIIRSIYENSFLAGDIYNKNVDTLLHNYLDK
jgi:hypothetical protein